MQLDTFSVFKELGFIEAKNVSYKQSGLKSFGFYMMIPNVLCNLSPLICK